MVNVAIGPCAGKNRVVLGAHWINRTYFSGKGTVTICCHLHNLPLMPGSYLVDLHFGSEGRDLDVVHSAIVFEVMPGDVFGSGKLPPKSAGPIFWPATRDLKASSN